MDLNSTNRDWEKEAPRLAEMTRANPFSVPPDYFSELQSRLQGLAYIQSLADHDSTSGFTVPDTYFNELPENISSSLKMERLKEDVKEAGYSVPEGYFTTLNDTIKRRTVKQKHQKSRISHILTSWGSYAAAASMALIASIGIFLYQQNNTLEAKLARIPEDDIVNYLKVHSDPGDFPVILENLDANELPKPEAPLSDKEIQQYLESTTL